MALETSVSPGGGTGTGTGTGSSGSSGGSPSPTPGSSSSSSSGTQPGTGTPGTTGSPSSGDPTFDHPRFKEVNDKYTALKWAEAYDNPEEVNQGVSLHRWFNTDPQGAYEYVTGLMKRHGVIQEPQTRQSSTGQADKFTDPKTGRPLPDIIIQETGQRFYSAEQSDKLVEWTENRLDQRLKQLEGQNTATSAQQEARQILNEAQRTWPGFSDFAEDIFKEMQRDRRITLETAYRRIAVPKLRQVERAALMKETQERAQAGTGGINPGQQTPQQTAELRKLPMTELFRREMAKRGLGK